MTPKQINQSAFGKSGSIPGMHIAERHKQERGKMTDETIEYEKRDSIEVSKNAKGEHSWKIKRYYDAGSEDYKDIVNELVAIDGDLKERFG